MARLALAFLLLLLVSVRAGAEPPALDADQARAFRSWFLEIVRAQMERGANPRWKQRDCAGLVRFAAMEAFRRHDAAWRKANGYLGRALPPDLEGATGFDPAKLWETGKGKGKQAFVRARDLALRNARFITNDVNEAQPGDLLYFDQGDDQHLMVLLGAHVAYHTGKAGPKDDGLRVAKIDELMNWKDTRWQINAENTNFRGFYRFSFLRR